MATRYSGDKKITVTLVPKPSANHGYVYKVTVDRKTTWVGLPAHHIAHAVDSADAYDSAAQAGVSFLLNEDKISDGDLAYNDSGLVISRKAGAKSHRKNPTKWHRPTVNHDRQNHVIVNPQDADSDAKLFQFDVGTGSYTSFPFLVWVPSYDDMGEALEVLAEYLSEKAPGLLVDDDHLKELRSELDDPENEEPEGLIYTESGYLDRNDLAGHEVKRNSAFWKLARSVADQ